MREILIKDDLLENLAAKDHELWIEYKVKNEYHLSKDCPFKPQPRCAKCNDLLVPFSELREEMKEINRLRWRTMPQTLVANGLTIVDTSELRKLIAEKEALENVGQ